MKYKLVFLALHLSPFVIATPIEDGWDQSQFHKRDVFTASQGCVNPISAPAQPPASFDWEAIKPNYPWREVHDSNRPGHAPWGAQQKDAYCLHVRPGSRKPEPAVGQYPSTYLPRNCTDMLHSKLSTECQKENINVLFCGDINEKGDEKDESEEKNLGPAAAYILTHNWNNLEECRAGCETCFDAMAEFGAEQAVCRRSNRDAHCAVGLVMGSAPALHCKDPPDIPGVATGCDLNMKRARWAEMNFPDLNTAFNSNDVKAYYVDKLPEVGYEVKKDWGKNETLIIALEEGWRWIRFKFHIETGWWISDAWAILDNLQEKINNSTGEEKKKAEEDYKRLDTYFGDRKGHREGE